MSGQLNNMNAIIQFNAETGAEWNDVNVPIPNGLWVYDQENNTIKEGDGETLFQDLLPIINFNKVTEAKEFYNTYLPKNLEGYNSKILVVNSTGDGYAFSTINIGELLTQTQLNDMLASKSTIHHDHNDVYARKTGDIMTAGRSRLSTPEADVVSYLILEAMDEDSKTLMKLVSGYADEFVDESGINQELSTYEFLEGAVNNHVDTSLEVVANVVTADKNVTEATVLLRLETDSILGGDLKLEISRDGGETWCSAKIFESVMRAGDIQICTGTCGFNSKYASNSIELDDTLVGDNKGEATTFTVDEAGASGHFNKAVGPEIVGQYMKLDDIDGPILITNVNGDGTDVGSVEYDTSHIAMVLAPTVTSPSDQDDSIMPPFNIALSDFGIQHGDDSHESKRIVLASDAEFTQIVHDTGTISPSTEVSITDSIVSPSDELYIRGYHKGTTLGWSMPGPHIWIRMADQFIGHGVRVAGGIAIGPYDFADGEIGYMVVAPSNQRYDSESIKWCTVYGNIDGLARSTSTSWVDPHTGIANTHHLAVTRPGGRSFPAATYCNDLSFEGCDDFFLPNKNELEYIYGHRDLIDSLDETGDLNTSGVRYWSSSEYSTNNAWYIRFSGGSLYYYYKHIPRALVPVRRVLV